MDDKEVKIATIIVLPEPPTNPTPLPDLPEPSSNKHESQ
jgi:hypothetical protein